MYYSIRWVKYAMSEVRADSIEEARKLAEGGKDDLWQEVDYEQNNGWGIDDIKATEETI